MLHVLRISDANRVDMLAVFVLGVSRIGRAIESLVSRAIAILTGKEFWEVSCDRIGLYVLCAHVLPLQQLHLVSHISAYLIS